MEKTDKDTKNPENELFDSEWAIMEVVWEHEPCTAPDVTEKLAASKDWAYTTVKTLMDRMVKKGLLEVEKVRNMYLYSSVLSRSEARRGEIMRTVKRAFNGMLTPMMQFMIEAEDISADEFDELEKLIRERKMSRKK